MGSSHWSDDFYKDREVERARTGKSAFTHHDAVVRGEVKRGVHAQMDPKKVVRESRDSEAHPESLAIGVILDVTGSMHDTPRVAQAALPKLMGQLKAGGVDHPQILFGAVGDFHSDAVALQTGQFESGIEMDDDLGRIFMEGGGGGSYQESYQDALYFFARKTSIDCMEKRGQKGFLFLIGDEHAYPSVSKAEVKAVFGDSEQADIPTEEIVKEAQSKFNVFFIVPRSTSHGRDPELITYWQNLLGKDNVLTINTASEICEIITETVTSVMTKKPVKAKTKAASATVRL